VAIAEAVAVTVVVVGVPMVNVADHTGAVVSVGFAVVVTTMEEPVAELPAASRTRCLQV
jgi:hypothetical protein